MATQWTAGLVDGTPLPAATLNTIGAAWETYTPAWSSTGTQPVLGNGVLTGAYGRINKTVFGQIFFVSGSTSTYGTGTYRFTLPPFATKGPNAYSTIGYGYLLDGSTANVYTLMVTRGGTSDKIDMRITQGGFGEVTAVAPMAFASGDQLRLSFFYEAA